MEDAKQRPRRTSLLIAAGLFVLLALIAAFVRDDFIRPYGGDILVVMFLYFLGRGVTGWGQELVAVLVLAFAIGIEMAQALHLFDSLSHWPLASVVMGHTADLIDIAMYVIGVWMVVRIDRAFVSR